MVTNRLATISQPCFSCRVIRFTRRLCAHGLSAQVFTPFRAAGRAFQVSKYRGRESIYDLAQQLYRELRCAL